MPDVDEAPVNTDSQLDAASRESESETLLRRGVPRNRSLRLLAANTLARSLGRGALLTVSALYLTSERGVGAASLASALVVGGIVAVGVSTPAGYLADRWGARNAAMLGLLLEASVLPGYFIVRGGAQATALMAAIGLCEALHSPARGSLIAHALPSRLRVAGRAYLRSITNVGWAVGAAAGSVVLQFNTHLAYAIGLTAAATLHLLGALLLVRLPRGKNAPLKGGHVGSAFAAVRDLPYVAVAALISVLMVSQTLFTYTLPLWIVSDTSAPQATAGVLIMVNTVLVAVFQIRISRGVDTPLSGARAMRRSAVVLAVACVGYGLAAHRDPAVGVCALVAAALLHTWAECAASAGSWALLYGLAPDDSQGRHQAVGNAFLSIGELLSPMIAVVLVLRHGLAGWLVFSAVFAACGVLVQIATVRAQRGRPVGEAA